MEIVESINYNHKYVKHNVINKEMKENGRNLFNI